MNIARAMFPQTPRVYSPRPGRPLHFRYWGEPLRLVKDQLSLGVVHEPGKTELKLVDAIPPLDPALCFSLRPQITPLDHNGCHVSVSNNGGELEIGVDRPGLTVETEFAFFGPPASLSLFSEEAVFFEVVRKNLRYLGSQPFFDFCMAESFKPFQSGRFLAFINLWVNQANAEIIGASNRSDSPAAASMRIPVMLDGRTGCIFTNSAAYSALSSPMTFRLTFAIFNHTLSYRFRYETARRIIESARNLP